MQPHPTIRHALRNDRWIDAAMVGKMIYEPTGQEIQHIYKWKVKGERHHTYHVQFKGHHGFVEVDGYDKVIFE